MIVKDAMQDEQRFLGEAILMQRGFYLILPEFMKFHDYCRTNPYLPVFKKWISKKGEIYDNWL